MAKKFLHILLSLFFLFSVTGFTVIGHYCGDTLKSVAINVVPRSCCDMDGCCHNETMQLKVKDNFSAPVNKVNLQKIVSNVIFCPLVLHPVLEPYSGNHFTFPIGQSPPTYYSGNQLSFFQSFLC